MCCKLEGNATTRGVTFNYKGGVYGPYGGCEGSYLAKVTLGRVGREVLEAKTVEVLKVGTEHDVTDALTKVVPGLMLQHCLELLSVGGLQYLTFTRLDLSYVVQQICFYMHDLREPHLADLKRILRYVQETAWLCNLFCELHSPLSTATLVYCDNVSAVYMSANHVQHQRMEHIEIDIHFVRDMVTAGQAAKEIWLEVLKWWRIPNVSFVTLHDLIHLADHTPLEDKFSSVFDAIVQTTIWSIWRYRNNILFSTKRPSKDLIFNDR
nr:ribonuclease H-like domain-containing protein [Tanacetum cinerariifolium]